ncbi:GcvT family protein [Taklimakanibacter lacteus]|uniref:GcvT family protein n=1 Tax=Taklimakanibacter lacteus TaxID=2268456 RepID=UPI000E66990E
MQKHARVVVVGGGCVGAGILYGLTRRGWTDVVLLERTQLTAGSTWHAAGLVPSYTRNFNIGRMIARTIEIYEGLEADTGQSVGWHKCGQLRLANTKGRLDEFKSYMGVAEAQGTRAELLTPAEARKLWPLIGGENMLAALYNPDDGHIAPADVTQAMAKGARDRGAKVYLETEVKGFERTPGGEWKITTNRGDITCEHVVCATGNYARQTGALLGLDIPAIPIIHQYWITEPVPELVERKQKGQPEMPILRDEDVEGYIRQEGDGLMFGPYERTEKLKLFAEDGVPEWFGADLLEEDFDSVSVNWERAVELLPALGRAGIKANVRGPFQMTADELPLMGPAWGLRNVWLAEGVPGGILWGGAIGYYLSERIVEGANSLDTSDLDPRRFGDYANKNWTKEKVREAWGTHALLHYPGESLPAARPQKTAPSYDRLSELGAQWGVLNGWEFPNWYLPKGVEVNGAYSWRWTDYDKYIGEEVRAVRNAVGLVEMTPMTKFEVSGPKARQWLDGILASRLPQAGRVNLSHQLTKTGGVQAEYVVACLAPDRFYLISTPRAERWNFDELSKLLPADGGVELRNVTNDRGCFTIVGPNARKLLQALTEIDLSNEAFPWFTVRSGTVGLASDVRLLRVNYEGELGWELYHPLCYQRHLLDQLLVAGVAHGLRPVGLYALESLRLEKSYKAMFRDLNPELSAWESGIDRFIALDKGDFIGRDALVRQKEKGVARRLAMLAIESQGASSIIHEGVYQKGQLVGRVTSGGFSHTLGYDLAFALLPINLSEIGTPLEVPILGEMRKARVIADSPYDPKSLRSRS